jgi:superfamily II DNA/RNA helicase
MKEIMNTFEALNIDATLISALKLQEIIEPTEIQQKAIPEALQNKDIIVQSETGSGKTLAYLLPLYQKLKIEDKEMQALVLVPTHELAIQVQRQLELLSQNSEMKARTTSIIGDVNITRQIEKLREKPHIIVGSPGRILELIKKKKISAHTIKTIIVDEADRLMDTNNIENVKTIIKSTLKERQLMMFSATVATKTIEKAKEFMKDPLVIKAEAKMTVPKGIEHMYFLCEPREKLEILRKLSRIMNPPKAIVFIDRGDEVQVATEKLKYHGVKADSLHGANIKLDRKKTMEDFKSGRTQLLIASDVAARGLDIEGVTHIINVDIPQKSMDYLHRVGRTGRKGNSGTAISIITKEELPLLKLYEKELKIEIMPKAMYEGKIISPKNQKPEKL